MKGRGAVSENHPRKKRKRCGAVRAGRRRRNVYVSAGVQCVPPSSGAVQKDEVAEVHRKEAPAQGPPRGGRQVQAEEKEEKQAGVLLSESS